MSDTNYYDLLKNTEVSRYFSYMNDKFIKLTGPTIKVFKLDKKSTRIHELYGTETHSRIYLPPFDINAMYATNPWQGIIGVEAYEEREENKKIVVNFDNMVKTIRELKEKNIAELSIQYAGIPSPAIEKTGNNLGIYLNGSLYKTIDLIVYNTFKKLVAEVKTVPGMTAVYTENEECSKIPDFNLTGFKNQNLKIEIKNTIYDEMTDVIEMGDVIITEKWRVYEVLAANPTSDFGWNYSTYTLNCNLIELDVLDGLPGNYRREIEKHQYGLRKINTE